MPDLASIRTGASVVRGKGHSYHSSGLGGGDGNNGILQELTSQDLASTVLPWWDRILHSLRVPGRVVAEGPEAALSTDTSLGSCWAFDGSMGRLTVHLGGTTSRAREGGSKVNAVSLQHLPFSVYPQALKSAPRHFRVLGWHADPRVVSKAQTGSVGAEEGVFPVMLIERAEFVVGEGVSSTQTFGVSGDQLGGNEAGPVVGWVTLEVESNHGSPYTCLYGFRVHGVLV
ncbi:unnamed protein product [Choristocarpus tenellus]